MTDAVITYVNPTDKDWQKQWKQTVQKNRISQNISGARWRDYKTLPYLLDGIKKYMPWIRNIHLVVSDRKQVEGMNGLDNVNIVTHDDIIPKHLLPTFNSTVIELFLYRIPNLAEQFIYFNDDMFPVGPMQESDFFVDGKPALHVKLQTKPIHSMYAVHLKNGYTVASVLAKKSIPYVVRFGHSASPMLKSTWKYLWGMCPYALLKSCTPFRTTRNINQDIASYYQYLTDSYIPSCRKLKYTTIHKQQDVEQYLQTRKMQILCINDTGHIDDADDVGAWLRDCFEGKYKYNIQNKSDDSDSDSSN